MGKKKDRHGNKKQKPSNVLQLVTEAGASPERGYGDSLFRQLFGNRKNLLELYQTLHPEDQTTIAADLEEVHAYSEKDNGIYGEVGFRVPGRIIVVADAPYSVTPQLQMHCLSTAFQIYDDELLDAALTTFDDTDLAVPEVELWMLCSGTQRNLKLPQLHLDGSIISKDGESSKNDMIRMKTIGITEADATGIVREYLAFCRIRSQQIHDRGFTRTAVHEIVRICREQGYLGEYLENHEAEAIGILSNMFSEPQVQVEWRWNYGRTEREAGREEGRRMAQIETAKTLLKAGRITEEEIPEMFSGLTAEDVTGQAQERENAPVIQIAPLGDKD